MPDAFFRHRWTFIAALVLAPVFLFVPFFTLQPLIFFGASDMLFYTNLLQLTAHHMAMGTVYPRWLGDANSELGSAILYAYAPLAYQLTALLTAPLAPWDTYAMERFLIGIYLSQVMGGILAWRWLMRHFLPRIALAGALLYCLLPYKLVIVYLHANLAQLWAMAWLPLWLIGCERIAARQWGGIMLFGIGAALVCLTHQLTLLVFAPFAIAYTLWCARDAFASIFLSIANAVMLGAGLSAVYWLPMLASLSWFDRDAWQQGKFDVMANLNHMDIWLAFYGPIAITAAYIWARWRGNAGRNNLAFWLAAMFALTFMSLRLSAPIWALLPPLHIVQFPAARFQIVLLPGIVYTLCFLMAHQRTKLKAAAIPVVAMLFVIPTLFHIAAVYAQPAAVGLTPEYVHAMHETHALPVPGRLTRWSNMDIVQALGLKTPQIVISSGNARAKIVKWGSSRIIFMADVQSNTAQIQLRQLYIPLWEAHDGPGTLTLQPSASEGLLSMTLNKGMHRIILTLHHSAGERAGLVLSLISLLFLIAIFIRNRITNTLTVAQ